jgi:lipopolysaccharide transport system ATP-binding protein
MSAPPVISCEGLSKEYCLGVRLRGRTLRDALAAVPDRFRHGNQSVDRRRETLWALRDITFEVGRGEVVGIIGRNGAGKSTLLKIIARLTEPTVGRARIRGRLGTLLEVGTGFHGELTGRENIFLNGAILGMRRKEIRERFDEIVAFAEVERFLDTPVKRYSSGMTVRLAFAVAAHLEPEILLVDEVLAVGDVAFQRKCIGKMTDVAQDGRTILFVSHNMGVIQALCGRGIVLESGSVTQDAPIRDAVAHYLKGVEGAAADDLKTRVDRRGWNEVMLASVAVSSPDAATSLATGRPARFTFRLDRTQGFEEASISCRFAIANALGQPIASFSSDVRGARDAQAIDREAVFVCDVEALPLVQGRYRLDVEVHGRSYLQDAIEGAVFFDVEQGVYDGRPVVATASGGDVVIPHRWLDYPDGRPA